MTDDRLLVLLGDLDRAADPSPAFADCLYEALAADLGFRDDRAPARGLLARLGIRMLPAGPVGASLAWAVAVIGLMTLLTFGVAALGDRIRERLAPKLPIEQLVPAVRSAYERPPVVTLELPGAFGGRYRMTSEGTGTWRLEDVGAGGATSGSYYLWDGRRLGHYDATTRVWTVSDGSDGTAVAGPYPFSTPLTFRLLGTEPGVTSESWLSCRDGLVLGEDAVLGRLTDHFRCPEEDVEVWADRLTHLVLRIRTGPTVSGWQAGIEMRVASISFAAVDASGFAWSGPDGSLPDPSLVAVADRIHLGQVPPAWTGTDLDGKPAGIAGVTRPTLVVLWAPAFDVDAAMLRRVEAASRSVRGVDTVVVAWDTLRGTLLGYLRLHPTSLRILDDPPKVGDDTSLATVWGLQYVGSYVALDAGGRVVGVWAGRPSVEELAVIYRALEAGTTPPGIGTELGPTPGPEITPEPGSTPVSPDSPTSLGAGSRPTWSGLLAGGGSLRSADLAGSPTVVYVWPEGAWVGLSGFEDLEALSAIVAANRAGLRFVVVVTGESEPGTTEAWAASFRPAFDVVLDWDGAVVRALDVWQSPAWLAFSSDGALTRGATGTPTAEELAAVAGSGG